MELRININGKETFVKLINLLHFKFESNLYTELFFIDGKIINEHVIITFLLSIYSFYYNVKLNTKLTPYKNDSRRSNTF